MARPSAIYRSSQVPLLRQRYKFPVLDDDEIIQVCEALDFGISDRMLERPTPNLMNTLVEQILDKFLYVSPQSLRQRVNETDADDDMHTSMSVMASQHIVYKFLCDCGVDDFSIRDISKPESGRVKVLLSAVINFARFREERMGDCDGLLESSDDVVEEYKAALDRNNELSNQVTSVDDRIESEGFTIEEVDRRNIELETRLKQLREEQKVLAASHTTYKEEKNALVAELEEESARYVSTEKDLEKVRPYIKESPESVGELIGRMQESLVDGAYKVSSLEEKAGKVDISVATFEQLVQEFERFNRSLDGTLEEARKLGQSKAQLDILSQDVAQNEALVAEANKKLAQVHRQLGLNEERMKKLDEFYSQKLGTLQSKLDMKHDEITSLRSRRSNQELEAAAKKSQIAAWRRQLTDLQQSFDKECKDTAFELGKLQSQIKLYDAEMTKKMAVQARMYNSN